MARRGIILLATIACLGILIWNTVFWKKSSPVQPLPNALPPSQLWPPGHPWPPKRPPGWTASAKDEYLLGVGKFDITGPFVELNLMGYANTSQVGTGLRQRLFARAFIIADIDNPQDRFVYVVLDTQSGDTAIRHGLLEWLKKRGGDYAVYGQHNVAVVGTHSHSGPGAWLNYLLPQITSKGFYKGSYQAIVTGALNAVYKAHRNLAPGHLSVGEIDILDANLNRSPYAYLANPPAERERYEHDVDKTMTMLRFTHTTESADRDIGVLTWFPVHGTSMHGNNTLVTGDNKGVAAWLFEEAMGDKDFVAGFSQANVGDTTPNVLGAYCEYGEQAGEQCDFKTSLCGNKTDPCRGRGPYFGRNDAGTASTYEIGRRQFEGAHELFRSNNFTPIVGNVVKSFHQFVDLSAFSFTLPNGTVAKTCPAALGYSFAAGTSDGPGVFDFKQAQPNDPNASPLWRRVRGLIHEPNDTQKACHGEKPILLDVGESHKPYDWSPNIVDVQTFRVGQMFIIVSPGEATTMAGRRWRDSLASSAAAALTDFDEAAKDPVVVLGGPANSYTHYITTAEEYSVQRYEGASTLYGVHTLDAYINITLTNLPYLAASADDLPPLDPGPSPPVNTNRSLSFISPVLLERAGLFKNFGDVVEDVNDVYKAGDTISARFVGANPRDLGGGNIASVETYNETLDRWMTVRDGKDWGLVFEWKRTSTILGTSEVTISWETKWETGAWQYADGHVPTEHHDLMVRHRDLEGGPYRLRYLGAVKHLGGKVTRFQGASKPFMIEG